MSEVKKDWYKELVVYQIWPRSFCDSDGDGIGDLKGIYSKLDYLKDLGVNAIWFSPLYPTPNADYGYDIADYRNINPEYGTLDDFKMVLEGAHERGMKVIMDLVVNHTSDEHEWFKESLKGEDNPYHDYYFWRKGKDKKPPNNWLSTFEGGAWEYNEDLDKYYLHVFAKKQPDLNMDNPKVREEVKDIMRFWLDMGVDGFREDVITFISKAEGLPNGFPLPAATGIEHYKKGPHLDEYLKEFREDVIDKYDCFVVAEGPMMTTSFALPYITEGPNKTLDMMFHFQHMEADCMVTDWVKVPFSLKKMKGAFSKWQYKLHNKGWNALYIENHDHPRIINRYGSLDYRVESGKMLAAMYMLQCGTPFIYQGQEIGMTNVNLTRLDEFKDVLTFNNHNLFKKLGYNEEKFVNHANKVSRETARSPVQWNAEENAGFTTGKPWFNICDNYKEVNVEAAENDPDSILHFYRKLIKFKKENKVAIYGKYKEYYPNSSSLYVYERVLNNEKLLVICSFKENSVKFKAPAGYDLSKGELIFNNYNDNKIVNNGFVTKPYEVRVYKF
ncbi:MAG: alpha-glucosidase [Clostridia bacterium]|nr:alpha-glucosidase [Clostridia bacterium]